MKKRLSKYIKHLFVKYIPGTNLIANIEAKRLSIFICENYNEKQQFLILEDIKKNIILYREQQIVNSKQLIKDLERQQLKLEANLILLNTV